MPAALPGKWAGLMQVNMQNSRGRAALRECSLEAMSVLSAGGESVYAAGLTSRIRKSTGPHCTGCGQKPYARPMHEIA
jgi:hypothetical protein